MINNTLNLTMPGTHMPVAAIWLVADGESKPYLHQLSDDCKCKSCESKIRLIIYPAA